MEAIAEALFGETCTCDYVGDAFPGADKYLGGVRGPNGAMRGAGRKIVPCRVPSRRT